MCVAAAKSSSTANCAQHFTMHTPDEQRVEKQSLLPTICVPLERIDGPEEQTHLDALDSASISDEIVVALDQRFGSRHR
jgi:hypothetical protein